MTIDHPFWICYKLSCFKVIVDNLMVRVIKFNFFSSPEFRGIFFVKDVKKFSLFWLLDLFSEISAIIHHAVSLLLCREEIGILSTKEEHGMIV